MPYRNHMGQSPKLDLVLLGESGSGKSASGNTILGPKFASRFESKFASRPSSTPLTTECQVAQKTIRGTPVTIIDTPDLSDEDLLQLNEHVKKCRNLRQGNLCVYLLVIQIGRFTVGERDILERLEKKLGMIRDRTIILFTGGDDLDQHIDDYVKNTNTHLQRLIRECGGRYQVFNNRKRNDYEVEELMGKIAKLVKETDMTDIFIQEKRKIIWWYCVGGIIIAFVVIISISVKLEFN